MRAMPYQIEFSKQLNVKDTTDYFNDCCIGGDLVAEQFLAKVRQNYADVQFNQEDWGWFIWFKRGKIKLAIDIFTEDFSQGKFKIHLTSRTKKWLVFDSEENSPELDEVRDMVVGVLAEWTGQPCSVETT